MPRESMQDEETITLADSLSRQFTVEEILELISELAVRIEALHTSGKLHLRVCPESVFLNSSWNVSLKDTDRKCFFGREHSDQQLCPPELQNIETISIPVDIQSASESLRHQGLRFNPTRIDTYQLGAIFCLLLTGETVHSYLRSSKTKAKVPADFRILLERVLGYEHENIISDIKSFQNAIHNIQTGSTLPTGVTSEFAVKSSLKSLTNFKEPDTQIPTDESIECANNGLPFQSIGHYQILEKIGQGGMGDVYKGFESSLDRIVAIKVLPQEFARQESFVKRFYAEATAAAKLIHPNIIQIYFIGEDHGHYYFSMQFVEGETLADLLKRKKIIDIEQTLAIIEQVLLGLSAAHKKGMIHRDIKPGNILLDRASRKALLADFGLVKSVFGGTDLTATGVIMGTVDYISPEHGRGLDVDTRSDLYSLGILMYQMLSGHLPYHADSPTSIIFQHAYETPTPLNELAPSLPETLVKIVSKLMVKSPALRYQSAESVIADIHAFRNGANLNFEIEDLVIDHKKPLVNQSYPDSKKAKQPSEYSKTVIIQAPQFEMSPLLPEELGTLDIAGFWQRLKNRLVDKLRNRAPELLQQLQNTQQQLDGVVFEYQRRQKHLQSTYQQAKEVLVELQAEASSWNAAAIAAMQKVDHSDNNELLRDAMSEKIRCNKMAEEIQIQIMQQQEQLDSMSLQLSQVNAKLQQLVSQRDLLKARLKSAQAQAILLGKSKQKKWSLDKIIHNSLIILLTSIIISLMIYIVPRIITQNPSKVATTTESNTKPDPNMNSKVSKKLSPNGYREAGIIFDSYIKSLEFRPNKLFNGYHLASLHENGSVQSLNVRDYNDSYLGPHVMIDRLGSVNSMAYSPDGLKLAVSKRDGSIHIWNVNEPAYEIRHLEGHSDLVYGLLFSSDGSLLLSGGNDSTVRLWNLKTGQEIKRINVDYWVRTLAWSRGERSFFSGYATQAGLSSVKKWDLDGTHELFLPFSENKGSRFLFIPQFGDYGFSGAFERNQPLVQWNRDTGEQIRTFGVDVNLAAISATGSQILTSNSDGKITLWNSENGEKRDEYQLITDTKIQRISNLAVSKDGKLAACSITDRINQKDEVRIWKLPLLPQNRDLIHIESPINSIMFSPDGYEIVAGTRNHIRSWEINKTNHDSFFDAKSPVSTIKSMSDGSGIIYGTGARNSTANMIGIRAWKNFGRTFMKAGQYDNISFEGHQDQITSVDCSSSNKTIVSSSLDGTVRLWNLLSQEQSAILELNRPIYAVRFKPQSDHEVYICSNHKAIELWNLKKKLKLKEYRGMTFQVLCMDLSEDGTRLVAGGGDHTIRVWDAQTTTLLATLEGHTGPVNSVAMSAKTRLNPVGGFVVSGSDDTTVRFWDVQQQKEISRFPGHIGPVRSVAISPRNQYAISGSDDGTIRRWKLRKPNKS